MTADRIAHLETELAEMTRRRDEWRAKAEGYPSLAAAVRKGIEDAGERNLSRVFLRGALVECERRVREARRKALEEAAVLANSCDYFKAAPTSAEALVMDEQASRIAAAIRALIEDDT